MAAIVRVKRRINDDPADSLLLSCKRPRRGSDVGIPEPGGAEEVKNLFKFAATIKAEDERVSQAVRDAIKKEKLEKEYKLHSVNPGAIQARARAQCKSSNDSGRYKLVSKRRALQLEDLDKEDKEKDAEYVEEKLPFKKGENKENMDAASVEAQKLFFLYDVEQEGKMLQKPISRPKVDSAITCNDVPLEREQVASTGNEEQYVYDLYYLNRLDLDFGTLDNVMNIEAYHKESDFDHYRDADNFAEAYDDEDDSNDESNWRNDYPDEDPKFFENDEPSFGTDDQGFAAFGCDDDEELDTIIDRGLHLGGGAFRGELSSDEEEKQPEFDFGATLSPGIWGNDAPSTNLGSNIWGNQQPPPRPQPVGSSDAVADDWVSKSLGTPFNPDDSGLWGSSLGANPWMTETSPCEDRASHRLWAPATDFDTYKSRVLQSLEEDRSDPSNQN